ncbi:MAG: ribosome small subunit-dependent GTPase A [Clostridia bacterium]|nr:ribosome small subunit-dependent GTPase A [Clostridia bacterium]
MASEGRIIKGIGGFYYVKDGDKVVTCKAKGAFRNKSLVPMVGDIVRYETFKDELGQITEILPRKNSLIRPMASNIDLLAIVVSASSPSPDWLLLDKLIIAATRAGIKPLPILNKIDDADPTTVEQFLNDYREFESYMVSAVSGEGLDKLRGALSCGISCFAGQSAVGKTSILNALLPGLEHETGELSQRTRRGKHTTRSASLIPFLDGAILDTPGFSLLESELLSLQELLDCYPEFRHAEPCRFSDCSHTGEPDCGVKLLLEAEKLSLHRYQRYVTIYKENENRRKHLYD